MSITLPEHVDAQPREVSVQVLVVDDEPDIRRFLSKALSLRGLQVDTAPDGATALQLLSERHYDLMLLDVLMPGRTGVEVLPLALAQSPALRVLMISALNEPRTRVQCLELGAVDYVTKPFVLAELVARIKVHARLVVAAQAASPAPERRDSDRRAGERRGQAAVVPAPRAPGGPTRDGRYLKVSGTTLDLSTRELHTRERIVALSEREALLLAHLMRHAGVVCSRQQILQEVWGADQAGGGNVVDVCVARLRAKLPPDTVSTVRGAGYVFPAA